MRKRLLACFLTSALMLSTTFGCTPIKPLPQPTTTQEETIDTAGPIQAAFDAFLDRIFQEEVTRNTLNLHYTLKDPAPYGIENCEITLGEASLAALQESIQDTKQLLQDIHEFDSSALRPDQQQTYDILVDYMETALLVEPYLLYVQELSPTIGTQSQLPILLAEYVFRSEKDVQDYLQLLSLLPEYYQQLLAFEQEKSTSGLFMSDRAVDDIVASCEAFLADQETHYLLQTFEERILTLPDLDETKRNEYILQNRDIFTDQIVPAYQMLMDGLSSLKGTGQYEGGLCAYPDGKAYFEYLIAMGTGTGHRVEELKTLIDNRIKTQAFELSYRLKNATFDVNKLTSFSFSLTDPPAILEHLKGKISEDFPAIPDTVYTIKTVPKALENTLSPAFYLTPPFDAPFDHVIYINNAQLNESSLFSTLAHEGYPGHLYQSVYAATLDRPPILSLLSCRGYSEGWATYVEHEAYAYDTGNDAALNRIMSLNSALTLGIYALADIGINYDGWSLSQTDAFLAEWFDRVDQETLETFYYTLVEEPGNYLNYYVGYLEILLLREEAEDALDDRFDLKAFHTFLLDLSDCSFRTIRKYFDLWLDEQCHATN